MKMPPYIALIVFSIILIVIAIGCDDDKSPAGDAGNTGPTILSVAPADNAINVPATTMISIKFNVPMDSQSVMLSFHCLGGQHMYDLMDSLNHHMGSGGHMMNMDHLMGWMDSTSVSGDFHWNDAVDSCWFAPESSLAPDTEYMIFMNGDIMSRDGGMMDMHHLIYDSYMSHFTTEL
jgi:hypothetical protein